VKKEIGIVKRIFIENERAWTIGVEIQFGDRVKTFGGYSLLVGDYDIAGWWLKRIGDAFNCDNALGIVGRPAVSELDEAGRIESIAGIDCYPFRPKDEIDRRTQEIERRNKTGGDVPL